MIRKREVGKGAQATREIDTALRRASLRQSSERSACPSRPDQPVRSADRSPAEH
jgi:hypothetical protein